MHFFREKDCCFGQSALVFCISSTGFIFISVSKEKENNREAFGQVFSRVNGEGGRTGDGVKVSGVYEDETTDLIKAYDPSHPDADADGYVWYPNVNVVTEMTNMIDSSRAYEANATAFTASKTIAMKGLEIGNGQ